MLSVTGAGPSSSAAQASSSNGSSVSSLPSPLSLQLSDELDLSLEELQTLDSEGRALITHHGMFVLVNLYGEVYSFVTPGEGGVHSYERL